LSGVGPSEVWFSDDEDDIEPVVLAFEEPDDIDDSLAIDEFDYMQEPPTFGDFDVWCTFAQDWATTWRPGTDGPWFCRNCGATDHQPRDHEGAGA
jgi:hypothetical protein